jgi:hypothetical protein
MTGAARRAATAAARAFGFGARYLRSPTFRARVADADDRRDGDFVPSAIQRVELRSAPPLSRPYRGIDSAALSLAARGADGGEPAVVLVLPRYDPDRAFAGARSAVLIATALAEIRGSRLRIIALDEHAGSSRSDGSFIARRDLGRSSFSSEDIWVVTHWTTAFAAHVAAISGRLDPARVVYLIQDFEPGFSGYSSAQAAAALTYRAGFLPLVNSRPLAAHLERHAGVRVPDGQVFAPLLDDALLRETADSRAPGATRRVLFYARPSKPRNMFELGVAALEETINLLGEGAVDIEVLSAGEAHPDRELGRGVRLHSLGALDRLAYHRLLSTTDVVLALQASPHPSHLPLESAIAGARAVTNDFEGSRVGLHPRLTAVEADVPTLARAIIDALDASGERAYLPLREEILGRSIDQAIAAIARQLESPDSATAFS